MCSEEEQRGRLVSVNKAVIASCSVVGPPNQCVQYLETMLRDRYDWTTGVPDNGNDWRKFHVVSHLYPLRSLVFYFV